MTIKGAVTLVGYHKQSNLKARTEILVFILKNTIFTLFPATPS